MILYCSQNFTVTRQIANHLDTNTYYVRAVIRNAYTDAIITTLDLTDRGGQRFSTNWQVPVDVSGAGFYVSIVTSVYTDSGYTTKSENYGDEADTYLVQDRNAIVVGGGGGGTDYYRVRQIIKEELAILLQEIISSRKEHPEMRWDELLKAIEDHSIDTGPILEEIKKAQNIDFSAVLKAIEDKSVTPPADLAGLVKLLEAMYQHAYLSRQEIMTELKELASKKEPQTQEEEIKEPVESPYFDLDKYTS